MRTVLLTLVAIFITFGFLAPLPNAEEVTLRNGNKIDYGPTWEKDGMVHFYFHDYGIAAISKTAIVGKTGLLGELKGDYFISDEYNCKISVPRGWHAANAVEAIDLLPVDENSKKAYQDLAPDEAMKKLGFLVILYENRPWGTGSYNPRVVVKVQELSRYSGVRDPLAYLMNLESKMKSKYNRFQRIKRPTLTTVGDTEAARTKFSHDIVIDGKPVNITQWEYALVDGNKVYSISAIDRSKEFRSVEKGFLKSLESFRFLN